ncbi:MAG: FlgD immunoglobulin-like domain containing protein, partial [Bacteroidota bacterium]
GQNDAGATVPNGDYSVEITAYDQGYSEYTEIFYDGSGNGLSTRGVTAVKNPALRNFGFIFGLDSGGFQGTTGILRLSADGRPWGNAKGTGKLNNTGITLGSGEFRYSPEADSDGYIYLIGHTQRQIVRFHTDTLNAALVDSGSWGSWYPNGIGILEGLSGKLLAFSTRNASGTASLGTDSRILSFHLNPGQTTHFGSKDTLVTSQGVVLFWDVAFGRDSTLYVTFNPPTGSQRPGVARFDLGGKTLPLTWADTSWTVVPVDSGRGNTLTYYHGAASDGSEDVLYFTIARVASGNPPQGQGIYAVTNVNASQPTAAFVYPDRQNNASITRSDVTVDAVGNIVYFENSNEEIVVLSPPTGPNNYTTAALGQFKVRSFELIADVRVDANGDFVPDRSGDTVSVIGVVNGVNLTASANRFQYSIQDDDAGIVITKGSQTGGGPVYQVGDRLWARGVLGQFNGTVQIDIVGTLDENVELLDSGNPLTPITLTIAQRLADPEQYESMLIRINGIAKLSGTWPATDANATLTMWDGKNSLAMFLDRDTNIDQTTEPVYPVNVVGIATQFDSSSPFDGGYQISPRFRTDFTENVAVPPSPYFDLLTPEDNSTVVLDAGAQEVRFEWRKALDFNNDNLIYQWAPVGFTAVGTTTSATDTFLVRNGSQLLAYMGTADTVALRWTAVTKDPAHPIVANADTFTVTLIRGAIVSVADDAQIPTEFGLSQNYPNPFNPSTTIRYALPTPSVVTLRIYNMLGQEVATLLNGESRSEGFFEVVWNGRDMSGMPVASGMYVYRIDAQPQHDGDRFVTSRKMMMLK